MDYANGLQGLVAVNHYNEWADPFATFRFIGTEGAIDGTIGLMYNYPSGRPDTIEITTMSAGLSFSYETPEGLMTMTLRDGSIPLAFPHVCVTRPFLTKSRLAAQTLSLSCLRVTVK